MTRPSPLPDEITAPFWSGVASGELRIQRCRSCGRYQHPPAALCRACASDELRYETVSGHAELHSWTEVHSGARHPAFVERTPYLLALVRLVEQDDVFFYTNLLPANAVELRVGAPFELHIERVGADAALPQFRPAR